MGQPFQPGQYTSLGSEGPHTQPAPEEYMTRVEVEELLAQQRAQFAAKIPQALVPANSGGPGTDNHQASWSLAEQEAANRGEFLEHWTE